MKQQRLNKLTLATGCLSLLAVPLPQALAVNITLNDTISSSGSWYGASEIHEVEPGCVGSHQWDLEAFTLAGNRLSLIGGYDFKNGYEGITSGHIFFDVNGDAKYGTAATGLAPSGNGNQVMLNPFGYDYAAVLNFADNSFSLYSLTASSSLLTGYYAQNAGSNPWRVNNPGGPAVANGTITYQSALSSADVLGQYGVDASASGANHNVISLDLPTLFAGKDILTHYTMGCGNDNIIGSAHVPGIPETPDDNPLNSVPDAGSTSLMLGLGLGAMGMLRRKLKA
jgi:hypothetical protein